MDLAAFETLLSEVEFSLGRELCSTYRYTLYWFTLACCTYVNPLLIGHISIFATGALDYS